LALPAQMPGVLWREGVLLKPGTAAKHAGPQRRQGLEVLPWLRWRRFGLEARTRHGRGRVLLMRQPDWYADPLLVAFLLVSLWFFLEFRERRPEADEVPTVRIPVIYVPKPEIVIKTEGVVMEINTWGDFDQALVSRVAHAVVRHSYANDVAPSLVTAVMRVENPWLIPDTVSYAGAVGLMQVMPTVWGNSFKDCGRDLTDVDVNVCKGVRVLSWYLDRHDTVGAALLAYNGCKRSPGCSGYADDVIDNQADF